MGESDRSPIHSDGHNEPSQNDNTMKQLNQALSVLLLLVGETSLTACIDENLENCDHDYRITYTVRLHANVETELNTDMDTPVEELLAGRLRMALADIFSDYARDIDLGFYTSDAALSHHEQHTINANQASFTLFIPMRDYMHLALANVANEPLVSKEGGERVEELSIRQQPTNGVIDSHRIGLFSARRPIQLGDRDQTFHVPLYMQNCAVALVVDPGTVAVQNIRSEMSELADGFHVRDSLYTFTTHPIVRMTRLEDTGSSLLCTYGVGFPSRDVPFLVEAAQTRAQASSERVGSYWTLRLYVTLSSGNTDAYTLYVREPLRAGELKIIKLRLRPGGGIEVVNAEVGVSVQLNWNAGGHYEV